uniref:putative polyvalent protein kinase domain-containing protein n=1 Tax=Flavobacterium sp. TaxID=239 RepID=UPI00404B70F3
MQHNSDYKSIKNELQNILSGKSGFSHDPIIQAVAHYLRTGERASPMAQEKHQNKAKEAADLIDFAEKNQLFYDNIDEKKYISEGAEQKVYIRNEEYVLKLNDAIYYASWEDYFNNLLLHNYFFPDTAYQLLGFHVKQDVLFAVVKQPFIKADSITNLGDMNTFMVSNNFINTKNHDYYHPDLGIILEDLHDENVLTNNGLLYFIDTVFYINPEIFWN